MPFDALAICFGPRFVPSASTPAGIADIGAAGGLSLGFATFTTTNVVWWLPAAREEARAVERATMVAETAKAVGELSNELKRLVLTVACAVIAAAWSSTRKLSTSKGQPSRTARTIVGTSMVGTRLTTPDDQQGIDDTVAGIGGLASGRQTSTWRMTKREPGREVEGT